jgi:Holliday junction DNA helicase RuvA
MIGTIEGVLREKSPTEVLLETGGIGFSVAIPLSTFEGLGDLGSRTRLYTHLVVREDLLQLHGFLTTQERDAFRLLLSVTGIGPRMAQGILSGISVAELQAAIAGADYAVLTAISGVGRKLAERLILELRDKVGGLATSRSASGGDREETTRIREEAILALIALGHNRAGAERAVATAWKLHPASGADVQSLVKAAIQSAR